MGERIAVVGAGGIGSLLAAELAWAGHDVLLCVRRPQPGIVVETDAGERSAPVTVAASPELPGAAVDGPVDRLFVATKSQDTTGARGWLAGLAGPSTTVAVCQNGLGHVERVRPLAPHSPILPVLPYTAVERLAPGRVRHFGGTRLVVPEGAEGGALAELLAPTGLTVEQDADFHTAAWRKLLSNSIGNPLTTLTLGRLGIMARPDVRELAEALVREAVAAGRADGADLRDADVEATLRLYDNFPPDHGSSMLYDRLAGRPLEHEALTGAVVAAADRHGIPVPLQRAVLTLLRVLDTHLA